MIRPGRDPEGGGVYAFDNVIYRTHGHDELFEDLVSRQSSAEKKILDAIREMS